MTIDLPNDLVRDLKIRAAHEGRKMKDVAAQIFRDGMSPRTFLLPKNQKLEQTRVIIQENGLPVFRSLKKAPASQMSLSELLELEQAALQEEDLQRGGLSS